MLYLPDMTHETALTIALALVSFLGGWLVKILWAKHEKFEKSHESQQNELKQIALHIETNFVRKQEYNETTNKLFDKIEGVLNKIESMKTDVIKALSEMEKAK
jgi:hypothetical protein